MPSRKLGFIRARMRCCGRCSIGAILLLVLKVPPGSLAQDKGVAQIESRPEINGIVTDPGVKQPLTEVTVLLFRQPSSVVVASVAFADQAAIMRTTTNAGGRFKLNPPGFGAYRVRVQKEGYLDAAPLNAGRTSETTVTLTSEKSRADSKLLLARPGEIAGKVLDDQSKKPLDGLDLAAYLVFYSHGMRRGLPVGFAVTRDDGSFVVKNLGPGTYVVVPRFRPWGPSRIVKEFKAEDAGIIDPGYETRFWPGGTDLASGLPVTIRSGDRIELGDLRATQTRFFRVQAQVSQGLCGEEELHVAVAPAGTTLFETTGSVSCGRPFLIRGLGPGSYTIEVNAVIESTGEPIYGRETFDLSRENVHVTIPVSPTIELSGKIVPPEGATGAGMSEIGLRLENESSARSLQELSPIHPDKNGNFHFSKVRIQEQDVELFGLPAGLYVAAIRYNGAAVRDAAIAIDPYAAAHFLEIALDNMPAAATGTVRDRDRPVVGATVILSRWPSDPKRIWANSRIATNDLGQFQFAGLAPGEYRLIAVLPEDLPKLEEPGVLLSLLSAGKKITISRGGFENLTIEPSSLQ